MKIRAVLVRVLVLSAALGCIVPIAGCNILKDKLSTQFSGAAGLSFDGLQSITIGEQGQASLFWQAATGGQTPIVYEIYKAQLTSGSDAIINQAASHQDVSAGSTTRKVSRLSLPKNKGAAATESKLVTKVTSGNTFWDDPSAPGISSAYVYQVVAVGANGARDGFASAIVIDAGVADAGNDQVVNGCTSATAVDFDKVDLVYEFPTTASKMTILRDGIVVSSSVDRTVTTFHDTSLLATQTYVYSCVATIDNTAVTGTHLLTISTRSALDAQNSFDGCVDGASLDGTRIQIDFALPPRAQAMRVYRNGVSVSEFAADLNVGTFIDTGLTEGVSYRYRCEAVFGGVGIFGSRQLNITTRSTNAPTFGGILSAAPSGDSVKLTWATPGMGVAASIYRIYATPINASDTSPAMSWGTALVERNATDGLEWVIPTALLGDEITYLFGVRSCAANGNCDVNTHTLSAQVPDRGAPLSTGTGTASLNNGKVVLSLDPWTHTQGLTAVRKVYWRVANIGSYVLAQTVTAANPLALPSSITLSVTVAEGTNYQFQVRDEDAHGNVAATSATISLSVTDLTPPVFAGITDLFMGSPADTHLLAQFTAIGVQPTVPSGATDYLVYVQALAMGDTASSCTAGTLKAVVPALTYASGSTAIYDISGLIERTRYAVCVKARDAAGNISVTVSQMQLTTRDVTAPTFAGLSSVAFDNAGNRVTLTWASSASIDLLEYRVKVWRGSIASPQDLTTFTVTAAAGPIGTTFNQAVFNYLDNETIYVLVDACDNASPTYGSKNCTSYADATAQALVIPDISPPPGFAGINTVTQTVQTNVTVSWHTPADWTGYRGFNVYDVDGSGNLTLLQACACSASNCPLHEPSCVIPVDAYRTYNFHVRAYDAAGNLTTYSPMSTPLLNKVQLRTMDTSAPSFNSSLMLGSSPGYLLTWNAATDNQYDPAATISYYVYRKKDATFLVATNPGAEYPGATVTRNLVAATSYTDSGGLLEGSTYYYTLCALDVTGNSKCDGAVVVRVVADITAPTVSALGNDQLNTHSGWNLTWTVSDNRTAARDLSIKVYRTKTAAAEVPATTGTPDMTGFGYTFGCDVGACTIPNVIGDSGADQYFNYRVMVTDQDGNATTTSAMSIHWVDSPITVTAVTRTGGILTGGKLINITGSNFATGATVKLGTMTCGTVVVQDAQHLSCITPDASGTHVAGDLVPITVTNSDGRFNPTQNVYYQFGGTGHTCDTAANLVSTFAGGLGTGVSPYLICNAMQLSNMRLNVALVYELIDNVDVLVTYPGGFTPIPTFSGTFYGETVDGTETGSPKYEIRRLTVNQTAVDTAMFAGMSGAFVVKHLRFVAPAISNSASNKATAVVAATSTTSTAGATFKNIEIIGGTISETGSDAANCMSVGGLAGSLSMSSGSAVLTKISVIGTTISVPGVCQRIGGIIGQSTGIYAMSELVSSVTINAGSSLAVSSVGGVIGLLSGTTSSITNVTVSQVTLNITGSYVGGVIGSITGILATSSFWTVSGNITGTSSVGGAVGYENSASTLTKVLSSANVSGVDNVAGILGGAGSSGFTIQQAVFTGSVVASGNFSGGLVGEYYANVLQDSRSIGSVTGNSTVGGAMGRTLTGGALIVRNYSTGRVIGATSAGFSQNSISTGSDNFWDTQTSNKSTSANATGKTTAEMKTQATFAAYDFINVWVMPAGGGYPKLQWEP